LPAAALRPIAVIDPASVGRLKSTLIRPSAFALGTGLHAPKLNVALTLTIGGWW